MVVLLLFNSADRLSYHEIAAATAIQPADLKRSLQSLACVKARRARKPLLCLGAEWLPCVWELAYVRSPSSCAG